MPPQLDRLEAALADGYRIDRQIGEGGMATVYLAEDLKHERSVALKVLKPELAQAIGHERFLREIKTTARLNHPHILPLLDSGEAGGLLYYVMPYVDGETLADRIAREKQLPLDDALQIAREVGDALSYAHAQEVVHRDIKPENILLHDRHAVVADFGISRAVDQAGGDNLTQTGMSVGTPMYMSPEQAGGDENVDGRSDLYSLACVLYEMLAGQPPFTGPTTGSIVQQHLVAEAAPITQIRPAVPAGVSGVLQRALAKNPADRFNPVAQFTDALRSSGTVTAATPLPAARRGGRGTLYVTAAAVAATLVAATFVWMRGPDVPATGVDDAPPSIAVLPFENIGGGEENEYFSDGITEDIIAHVSKVAGLKVISRTSVMQFKGTATPIGEIGDQLGVTTVLEGSVRRAEDQVRVVAQLIDTRTDEHLWSETYDRELEDIFAIQTDVAENIAAALGVVLGDGSPGAREAPTNDLAAYDLYLRGRVAMAERTGEAVAEAIAYFQQATDRDPGFALALAALAEAWLLYPIYTGTSTLEALEPLQVAADSALSLDPTQAGAHAALGFSTALWLWDLEEGERSLREAIRLDPGYATAHQWLGMLVATRRPQESVASLRLALSLDPLSRIIGTDLGLALMFTRDLSAAEEQFRTVIDLDPRFPPAYRRAAWVSVAAGNDSLTAEMLERWNGLMGNALFLPGELRSAFESGGGPAMFELLVDATESTSPLDLTVDRAFWLTALGRHSEAIDALERGLEARETMSIVLLTGPMSDPLQAEPRFQALAARVRGG